MSHNALLNYVTGHPLLLHAPVARQFHQVLQRHVNGEKLSAEAVAEIVAARDAGLRALPSKYAVEDGVGIVPVTGVIARHAHMVNGMSQPRGTSISQLDADLKKALDDPAAHLLHRRLGAEPLAAVRRQQLVDEVVEVAVAREELGQRRAPEVVDVPPVGAGPGPVGLDRQLAGGVVHGGRRPAAEPGRRAGRRAEVVGGGGRSAGLGQDVRGQGRHGLSTPRPPTPSRRGSACRRRGRRGTPCRTPCRRRRGGPR